MQSYAIKLVLIDRTSIVEKQYFTCIPILVDTTYCTFLLYFVWLELISESTWLGRACGIPKTQRKWCSQNWCNWSFASWIPKVCLTAMWVCHLRPASWTPPKPSRCLRVAISKVMAARTEILSDVSCLWMDQPQEDENIMRGATKTLEEVTLRPVFYSTGWTWLAGVLWHLVGRQASWNRYVDMKDFTARNWKLEKIEWVGTLLEHVGNMLHHI